jgi:DNA-binding response OmpR family regulator
MKNSKTRLITLELRLPEGEARDFLKALSQSGKRIEETETPIYEHLGLKVDLAARRIWARNKEVHLSPLQYAFLAEMVRHAGRVVTHRELTDSVWSGRDDITADCMRVFVFQIRHKIEDDPSKPQLLKTEPGVGYRLESPERILEAPSEFFRPALTAP